MNTSVSVGGRKVEIKQTLADHIVNYFNPVRGKERYQSRVMMALAGGYAGGSRKSKAFKNWSVSSGDADSDLLPDLPIMRERSRDLVRNTPLACGAINTAVTNVVGTGLKLNSMIDAEYLGLSEEEAEQWEVAAEREFNLWADSQECDAARTLNFFGHQDLAFRSTLENGDIFYTLPVIKRPGSPYGLKIQAIEADRISNENWARDSDKLAGGIETDEHGAPVNYNILQTHPGLVGKKNRKWKKIPAFGAKSGRRNIIHLFEQRRPGQRRGAPYLAPVIESLKQIGRYTDAELMAAVVSGMFTVFVKSDLDEPFSSTGNDEDGNPEYGLGNGAIVGLGQGDSIETANPGRPNTAFDPFVMAILRQIGSALEIPFELLIKHFTSSYSASRAAFMEAWKFFKKRRKWLSDYFCQPIYEAVLFEAVATGRLYAPGFIDDVRVRKAYLGAMWIGPGKGQIQEKVEVQAAQLRVDGGFSSIAQETAEMNGGDWSRNHRQRVKEQNARVATGLVESEINDPPLKTDGNQNNTNK